MQVVIEIPKDKYNWIKEHKGRTDFETTELLYSRIRNGTPLSELKDKWERGKRRWVKWI